MKETRPLTAPSVGTPLCEPTNSLPGQQPFVSLLIPAYNEAARLGNTLGQLLRYLADQPYRSEILVIDDGSSDGTAALAEGCLADCPAQVEARVISYQPNRGKGYAVRQGLLAARGLVAVFTDADLSTPITELPAVLAPIVAGDFDVVFGSRALEPGRVGVAQPLFRRLSGRIFNRVMQLATGLPFQDTQCGFKAFRRDVCLPVAEGAVLDRFGFDVELLCLAWHAGLRLREQPVVWNDAAGSKVGLLSGLNSFRELQQLRRRTRRGYYDEALQRTRAVASALAGQVLHSAALPA